jgi:hypothetical protein
MNWIVIALAVIAAGCGPNAYEMRGGLSKDRYQQTKCWQALGSHPIAEIERVCGKFVPEDK